MSDIVIGVLFYTRTKSLLTQQVLDNTLSSAKIAAGQVEAKSLHSIEFGDDSSDGYKKVLEELRGIRDVSGIEYIYAVKPSNNELLYVVDADGEAVVDPVNSTLIMILIICGVSFVVGIFVLFFIRKRLAKGFKTLNSKVEELAGGGGDLTKRIEITTGDSMEEISNRVNGINNVFGEIVSEIHNGSDYAHDIKQKAQDTGDAASKAQQKAMADVKVMEQEKRVKVLL